MHNKWLVLTVISAALFLIGIDMTVLYTALPTLTHDLNSTNSDKLWIINAYPLVMAGLLLGAGTLGDRVGHRLMFMLGLTFFGLASVFAAFAPSAGMLIAGRGLLAVGAAMMMPATLALLRHTFVTDQEQGIAMGIWGAVYSGAAAVGPLIGGFLLTHFWWGSVFLINVPVVLLALILTPMLIAKTEGNPERKWDLISSLLVMVGLVGLTYGLKEVAKIDRDWTVFAASIIISLVFLGLFVRRQRRSTSPLVDFDLFKNPRFRGGVIAIVFSMVVLLGVQLVLTQRLQLVEGLAPLQAGLFMVPVSLASFLAGPIIGSMLFKIGIGRVLWVALAFAGIGLLAFVGLRMARSGSRSSHWPCSASAVGRRSRRHQPRSWSAPRPRRRAWPAPLRRSPMSWVRFSASLSWAASRRTFTSATCLFPRNWATSVRRAMASTRSS
ncbi:MAG: MFS transporter [Candidatus Devosia phytovorans]|uniref:MFS transporter n=1 Tax=Candidatus Devosia phytovorans TaxID=3121372 RepID=A0AAJ5VTX9_9HYPH|nr:MFS transporter [Devosia sp.]WEK04724.1 MAG: MFS transporter [Devosia sp.]